MMEVSNNFSILLVCTGNVCRSPVAQLLLSSWLNAREGPGSGEGLGSGEAPGIVVASAGTRALAGHPLEPHAAALLPERISTGGFRARQLTPHMVREADVVLCLDRQTRSETVGMLPSALKRVFALREFGRMLRLIERGPAAEASPQEGPAEHWRKLVAAAPSVRPRAIASHEEDDDVSDPYGRSAHHYGEMMRQMEPALAAIWDAEQARQRWPAGTAAGSE